MKKKNQKKPQPKKKATSPKARKFYGKPSKKKGY